jgi:ABC-type phosphate transport system substrate-binding protein
MNKQILKIFSLLIGLSLSTSVWADNVAVIVNKDNDHAINKALIAKIYTGKDKEWSNGDKILLLDLPENSPTRVSFSNDILGKSVSGLKFTWAQMMFSGVAVPPKVVQSDEEVKKYVAENKNAIGYIKASSLDDSVKVVIK